MGTETRHDRVQLSDCFKRLFVIGSLLLMVLSSSTAYAQATPPSVAAVLTGGLQIGSVVSGKFQPYSPVPSPFSINAKDSIQQVVTGNLIAGTDASGREYSVTSQTWSWVCSTTYSWDNTNYGSSSSNASLTAISSNTANLFATFTLGGYYYVQYHGHVDFMASNSSSMQHLDTQTYGLYFSVSKPDFDFNVTDIAVNQGESGTFISTLTPINNFSGTIGFSNPALPPPPFSVSGSGSLPTPGTAPITISASSSTIVGQTYPVWVRGTGMIGSTTQLIHDKQVNVSILKRQAWITYGGTYSRAQPNKPQLNPEGPGVTNGQGDTVYTNSVATFAPNYSGYWSPNSTWVWSASPASFTGSPILNGTFLPGTIPAESGFTTAPVAGGTNYATLTLQDSKLSSGTSQAGYTLRYHHKHEDWTTDASKTVSHPLSIQPGGYQNTVNPSGEWVYLFSIDNPSPSPLTQQVGTKFDKAITMTGTFGTTAQLTVDDIFQFGASASISIGSTVTAEISATTTYTAVPYSKIDCYFAPSSQSEYGSCSLWGSNGYMNEDTWSGVYAISPNHPSTGQVIVKQYPGYKG